MLNDDTDETDSTYVPAQNFTLDQRDKALDVASKIDPYKLVGDDARHQILEGDINAFAYHRAVMLLIASDLKTVQMDRYTKENYNRWYRNSHALPNSVYDAWLLINHTTRRGFDVQLFFQRFPGMKKRFPDFEEFGRLSDSEGEGVVIFIITLM